ncbi:MAG: hypothetical protein QOG44_2320 [Acidimicrobiaceae bacterium]|jgi:hypothetical protein|nr:hypothetical protein [Acidimicrobiaceae bacterium]
MLEPPDIAETFASDEQRAEAIVQLLSVDRRLQAWLPIHAQASAGLPQEVRSRLLRQPVEAGDSPEARLGRWVTIFGDDIETVHDTRSRVVHGVRTPDGEIGAAIWLGQRLLDLLEGEDNVTM